MIFECISISNINWTAISAIASALMIIITGISIICSNRQNKENRRANDTQNATTRDLQVKLLSAELSQNRLDRIRLSISRLITALEDEDLVLVSSSLEKDNQTILLIIKKIASNVRIEITNLRLALNSMNTSSSSIFLKQVDEMYLSFRNMLIDLTWMAEYSPSNIKYDEWDNEILEETAKTIEKDVTLYMNRRMTDNPEIDKNDVAFIWNIFGKHEYSHDEFHDIWVERILHFDIAKFEDESTDYIKNELDNIDKSL